MRARAFENGWKFITSAYTDSVTKPGLERTIDCVKKLVKESETRQERKREESNELNLEEF